jgi:1,4-dihydroxy-2-naphthoyl-CoA hydrolase
MAGGERTAMPPEWEPAVPYGRSFDAQYGLEIVSEEIGRLAGRVEVGEHVLDRLGEVPSGVYAAMAETLASRGTALAVMPEGNQAMGLSNDTSRLAAVRAGMLHAVATAVARGDDAWVWRIETADDGGRTCAFSRVTVAVRPARRAGSG